MVRFCSSAPAAAGAACAGDTTSIASRTIAIETGESFDIAQTGRCKVPDVRLTGKAGEGGLAPPLRPNDSNALLAPHFHFDELEARIARVADLMAIAGIEVRPLARLVELECHAADAETFTGSVLEDHHCRLVLVWRRLLTGSQSDAVGTKPLVAGDRFLREARLLLGDCLVTAGCFVHDDHRAKQCRAIIANAVCVRLLRVTEIAHEPRTATPCRGRSTCGRRSRGRRSRSRGCTGRSRCTCSWCGSSAAASRAPFLAKILADGRRVRCSQVIDRPLVRVEPRDVAWRDLQIEDAHGSTLEHLPMVRLLVHRHDRHLTGSSLVS